MNSCFPKQGSGALRKLNKKIDENLLEIEVPFGGVLDDYAKIDVAIATADPPCDLFALCHQRDT
jgi:hypothetical protein